MKASGIIVVLASLGLLSLAGCASEKKPAVSPSGGPTTVQATPEAQAQQRDAVAKAAQDNEGGGLNISPEIMKLCPGIKPPKFGFDSAELHGEWADALGKLAECMKTGGLVGRGVLLTGHTDPRGEEDYNLALGGRRAESVKKALGTFGVEGGRLDVSSRGETDAVGSEEQSWSRDRRVDIDLRPAGKSGSGVSSR